MFFKMILKDKDRTKFSFIHSIKWHMCVAVRQMSTQHENKTFHKSGKWVCQ